MRITSEKPAPRWSVLAPVTLQAAPERLDWHATNISATGMFVSGDLLLDAGSELDVSILLPGGPKGTCAIASRVEVVWSRDAANASPNRPAGMGMRFLDIDAPMERELSAYLAELEAQQTKRKTSVPKASPPPPPVELSRDVKKGETMGRYSILDLIGTGGMGDVFLAEHKTLGRRVALKRLQEQHVHDRAAVRRFYDEARLVNQISHENIVEMTDLVVGDDHVFIVMELLEGRTIHDAIGREAPMPLSRIARIALQLCDALDACHRSGIVHRDLKPANIMLVNRLGNPDYVKLLDFGIAKLREETSEGAPGQVAGTPGFMAPEQLLGNPVDTRADLYSLGVVLFAMLTAQMPFVAAKPMDMMLAQVRDKPRTPSEVLGRPVPPELEALIMRCLERNPQNRPSSVTEIAAVLRTYA